MAEQLKDVEGEYVFYAAYLAKESEDELAKVNGAMLQNFIDALKITGAIKKIKRLVLVTGAKQYALQFGRPKMPMLEETPRIDGKDWPPNFYYIQQDMVMKEAKLAGFDWVVTYPNDVIGLATQNFMNLSLPLALYAAVNKELTGELPWPGSKTFYTAMTCFTSAKLHAEFCVWAALTPKCGNQTFNVINGDVESWQNLWPRLAARYGVKVPPKMLSTTPDQNLVTSNEINPKPPVSVFAKDMGLEGNEYVQPSKVEAQIDLTKWSQQDNVKAAWKKIAQREGIDEKVFEKATWDFLMFVLGRNYDIVISMSKARKFGWTGYRDTWESLEETFDELEEKGVVPKSNRV
jgi:nucleoside-diphosphate-sugar epimerase